jgi:hypothetical protein
VTLVIERDRMPLTLNVARQGSQVWKLRKELAEWRAWGRLVEAEPIAGPVEVWVEHLRKTRASIPDCGAPILAAKAVIDGLVDAGILPSDGPDVVTLLAFRAPVVCGRHGLRLTFEEVGT